MRKFVLKDFERKNKEKFERFEKFINNNLQITKEFKSLEELNNANLKYDYLISGSDQLWNLRANDFDWAYFLEFANSGKKISYAASFGPKKMVWTEEEKNRVRKDLEQYKYISVREEGSQNNIRELLGNGSWLGMDIVGSIRNFIETSLPFALNAYNEVTTPWVVMIMAPGAFFTLAVLIAIKRTIDSKKSQKA